MKNKGTVFLISALSIFIGGLELSASETQKMRVLGSVSADGAPAEDALVLALSLSEALDFRVWTNDSGDFALPSLPRGIYRIVAVKRGFLPAIRTIVPNRLDHSISLALEVTRPLTRSEREEIWAIRRSIPSDVLRELDFDSIGGEEAEGDSSIGINGRMMSMTGVSSSSDDSWNRSRIGISGESNGWRLDVDGTLAREGVSGASAAGNEATGLAMRVHSEEGQTYELSTTRGRWENALAGIGAAIESHRIGWKGDRTRLELRYLNQENVVSEDLTTERLGISGESIVFDGRHTDLRLALQVEQLKGLTSQDEAIAEFAAIAAHEIGRVLELGYGFRTRHSDYGSQWVPETVARVSLGESSSIVLSGQYKMYEDEQEILNLPAVVFLDESDLALPRYRYSLGFATGGEDDDLSMSAEASVAEVDSLMRLLFDNRFDADWDGLYLEAGDVHRELSLSLRKDLGDRVVVAVESSAGWAGPEEDESRKRYLTGALQSLYRPWGTSLDFSYRYVQQPLRSATEHENEKLAVRMGQSLRLPLDVRLLVGVDLLRDDPVGAELEEAILRTRFVGGLSLAF